MKIAIIGAGASGLVCIRKALQYGIECEAFEAMDDIGGQWYYQDDPYATNFGIPFCSSVYTSLRTNLPLPIMQYSDFKSNTPNGFPRHEDMFEYLKNYAQHFNLYPHIKFNRNVENVKRTHNGWIINVRNLVNKNVESYVFDGVAVCNGHNTVPFTITLQRIEHFKGDQIHSRYYRNNEPYQNKTVLIIGSGSSASDLAIECSQVAKKLILSTRRNIVKCIPNIEYKPGIKRICEDGKVRFTDDSVYDIDSIIYCTGYKYELPFLDDSCGIKITDSKVVKPLYKKLISIEYPSLCFIGLFRCTIFFRLSELQAETYMKILQNTIQLPSKEDMLSEEREKDIRKQCSDPAKYFCLADELKAYFEDLTNLANIPPTPNVLFSIFHTNYNKIRNDFYNLKKHMYEIKNDEEFVYK